MEWELSIHSDFDDVSAVNLNAGRSSNQTKGSVGSGLLSCDSFVRFQFYTFLIFQVKFVVNILVSNIILRFNLKLLGHKERHCEVAATVWTFTRQNPVQPTGFEYFSQEFCKWHQEGPPNSLCVHIFKMSPSTKIPDRDWLGHRYLCVLRVCSVNVVEKTKESRSPFCPLVNNNVMRIRWNPSATNKRGLQISTLMTMFGCFKKKYGLLKSFWVFPSQLINC